MATVALQTWLQAQSGSQLAGSLYFLGAAEGVPEEVASSLRSLALDSYEDRAKDPANFQAKVESALAAHASRFASSETIIGEVKSKLLGALSFEDLQRQLRDRVSQLDLSGAVRLFFSGGILSKKVSQHLISEIHEPRHKLTDLFLRRLIRLVTDPEMRSYSELQFRKDDPHDRAILKFASIANWRITDLFGRLTFLMQEEALAVASGRPEEILSPSLQLELEEIVEIESEEDLSDPTSLSATSSASTASTEGALMLLRTSPARQEMKIASYPLLRRHIFSLMAAERFQDAAEMLLTLRQSEIRIRFFQDLRMLEGRSENGFANAIAFYRDTASFTGLTLAAMPVSEAAHLLEAVVQEGFYGPWLIRAMAAIRPDQLAGLFGFQDSLPYLSTILGSLIENKVTRVRMHSLLALALDPNADHQKAPLFEETLDRLHERYPAFAKPQQMIDDDFATLFDAKLAARDLGVERPGGILGGAFSRFRQQTPQTRYLELPALDLATRQEVMTGLKKKLSLFFQEDWVNDKKWPLLSSQILLTLSPSEVWRLLDFQLVAGRIQLTRPEILSHLLLAQESDVVAAFFTAWGRESPEEEDRKSPARVLATLWEVHGEKGKRLVAAAVQEALEDPEATSVFQKILSEHGSDGDLMIAQMEMYVELAGDDRLGSAMNPYETFVTTGVLRPGDLGGRYRGQSIAQALRVLKNIDWFGAVEIPTRIRALPSTFDGDRIRPAAEEVPDLERIKKLAPEEQASRRRWALDVLVKLKADEPAVVNYFAARLGDEANEAFHVLDRLGPRAQKILLKHIQQNSTKMVASPWMKGARGLEIDPRVPTRISISELVKEFPLTSRAMQKYALDPIAAASKPYEKEMEKHGHIDRIANGEVKTPEVIQELDELGDSALILLSPEVIQSRGALIRTELKGSPKEALSWEEIIPSPVFAPLVDLAERVGTPKAHAALVTLYDFVRSHGGTADQARIVAHALMRMENQEGVFGKREVEVYLDFALRYGDLRTETIGMGDKKTFRMIKSTLMRADSATIDRMVQFLEEREIKLGQKAVFYVLFDSMPEANLRQLLQLNPLADSIFNRIRSEKTFLAFLFALFSYRTFSVLGELAMDDSPTNDRQGIAVKTLFCSREEVSRSSLTNQYLLLDLIEVGIAQKYIPGATIDEAIADGKIKSFFEDWHLKTQIRIIQNLEYQIGGWMGTSHYPLSMRQKAFENFRRDWERTENRRAMAKQIEEAPKISNVGNFIEGLRQFDFTLATEVQAQLALN